MLKQSKAFPTIRPQSRLEYDPLRVGRKFKNPAKHKTLNPPAPQLKLKVSKKSPSKQNGKNGNENAKSRSAVKEHSNEKRVPNKSKNEGIKLKNPETQKKDDSTTDFETFCSQGHLVYVDERDAGTGLGHLHQSEDVNAKHLQNKQHIGEEAYIPYSIGILKNKIGARVCHLGTSFS